MDNSYNFCSLCNKEYANRRNFLKHNRKVHGIFVEKPPKLPKSPKPPKPPKRPKPQRISRPSLSYKCNECQQEFSKKNDLIRHIKYHEFHELSSKGRRLICPECDESGTSYAELRKHITVVHNIELRTEKLTFDAEEGNYTTLIYICAKIIVCSGLEYNGNFL